MNNDILSVIANGTPGVSVTLTAADLSEVVKKLNKESERPHEAIKGSKVAQTLTRKEVMGILNVSQSTLWRWAKNCYLQPLRIGGKCLYRKSDIDRMLKTAPEEGMRS